MSNLGAGFPLRCFQRLSLPDVATRRLPLARQPVHQRSVLLGPLVLKQDPLRHPTPMADRDRTVSRRSEPSSRTALIGEQPNPWNLLQLQDAMSRHRGAKPCRRYELLGKISLLSPEYLLSVACTPRSQAALCLYTCRTIPNRPKATFARLRYPFGGDRPSQTPRLALSGDRITAPVRLPCRPGWYFTGGSAHPDGHASLPPTYPTQDGPEASIKLE